jgi:hypothetical protein
MSRTSRRYGNGMDGRPRHGQAASRADLVKPYDRGVQELTVALRRLVLEELAPCCKYIWRLVFVGLLT